jgi:hypothetical protein
MELTGLAEHEDFERGAEDMELRAMRQEADRMAKQEWEHELFAAEYDSVACFGHSYDEGSAPAPPLGVRCTHCDRRSEATLLRDAEEAQAWLEESKRQAEAARRQASDDDILF